MTLIRHLTSLIKIITNWLNLFLNINFLIEYPIENHCHYLMPGPTSHRDDRPDLPQVQGDRHGPESQVRDVQVTENEGASEILQNEHA